MSQRIAICPGSYDPVTLGHVDVIRRAAAMFDEVVVGVVRRPKHKEPLIPADKRVALLEESLAGVSNVRVEPFADLVVDFAAARAPARSSRASGPSRTSSGSSRCST